MLIQPYTREHVLPVMGMIGRYSFQTKFRTSGRKWAALGKVIYSNCRNLPKVIKAKRKLP